MHIGIWLCLLWVANALRSEENLQSNCYNFPKDDFSNANCITQKYGFTPKVVAVESSEAVDFSLKTPTGELVSLSKVLADSPVLLLWGMATCPAFRGLDGRFVGSSFTEENALANKLRGKVQILHIISSEPHPMWPYANYDTGNLRVNLWSTISQPQTYSQRMELSVPPVQRLLSSDIPILIDDLDGADGVRNNPVWCTYANAARAAVLIGQDGKVKFTQNWFNGPAMYTKIQSIYNL